MSYAAGQIVCRVTEEHLWESRQLGVHSPNILLNTLVYFNTKHFMLNTTEGHLSLSFSNIMKQWKKNTMTADGRAARTVYLRYNATGPVVTPTTNGKSRDFAVYAYCKALSLCSAFRFSINAQTGT